MTVKLQKNDLHPNSIISNLKYESDATIDSICPEEIIIKDMKLIPMHKANFNKIRNLFAYVSDDVFNNYGSENHDLPYETRQYIDRKEKL